MKRKCVAGAVTYNGQLLLMQRVPSRKILPDYWEIPGGGVDEGEILEQALIREIKEETGLNITSIGEQYYLLEDDRHIEPHYIVKVDTNSVVIAPDEHNDIRWISDMAEIVDLKITGEMKSSVTKALQIIKGEVHA